MIDQITDGYYQIGCSISRIKEEVRDMQESRDIAEIFAYITGFLEVLRPSPNRDDWISRVSSAIGDIDTAFHDFWISCAMSKNHTSWAMFENDYFDLHQRMSDLHIEFLGTSPLISIVRESKVSVVFHRRISDFFIIHELCCRFKV